MNKNLHALHSQKCQHSFWKKFLQFALLLVLISGIPAVLQAQTLAFPGAMGFGRHAPGARGVAEAAREVYVVTNLKDNGAGSFRDAVSKPGRVVTFAVGGIISLATDVVVAPNTTIAGQTAPGTGIVLLNRRTTFTSSNNTIARFLRIRYGGTAKDVDASGLASGANMIFDHVSFSWGTDEVFSINFDNKGTSIDNITLQNCIIAQGIHRHNHSASGLIQPPAGGKVSLIQNLYISNKTRNPKVKGINEFVNNVVYNWGNANRLGDIPNYGWSGEAYIMGGDSDGESFANIINNYFVGGPSTNPSNRTPFTRGNSNFNLYGAGNYFDNDRNGVLNGTLVPYDITGYPTGDATTLKDVPYDYPQKSPTLTAEQAYQYVIDNVGSSYPRRDQVDSLLAAEVASRGTQGYYVYVPSDLPFSNGGAGNVYNAKAPLDTDMDGMPDTWEDANGLNKNNKADAVAPNATSPEYMNIEVYINTLLSTPAPPFVTPPVNLSLTAKTAEDTKLGSVTIKWSATNESRQYFALERSVNGTTFEEIAKPTATATTYTDNNVTPNTTYYYRLKSVTASDESVYTDPVFVKVPQVAGQYDYKAGDYRTLRSGNWGSATVTTDIWETFDGTSWTPTATPPQGTIPPAAPVVTNIVIAAGHVITLNETTVVNNVIVESGATLKAGAATGSGTAAVKTLRVSNSIINEGVVGSSGTTTERVSIEPYRENGLVTLSGAETYYVNNFRVHPIAQTVEVVIDANMNMNGYLRAPSEITGAADGQMDDNVSITISTGRTVTLGSSSYLHGASGNTSITTTNFGNYTYTINGTLDMRATGTSCIVGHWTLERDVTVNTNGTWITGNAMRIVTVIPTGGTGPAVGNSYFNIGTEGLVDGALRAPAAGTTNFVYNPNAGVGKYPFFNITGKGMLKRYIAANATSPFPVGSGGTISIANVTNGATAGGFSVNVSSIDARGKMAVEKQWTVTPDFAATGGKVGLSWLTEDQVDGFNTANPSIYFYNNGTWDAQTATMTADRQGTLASPYVATHTDAITAFGTFMVANEQPEGLPAILPLNLTSFRAALTTGNSKTVKLFWSTANETNTAIFIIEKKTANGYKAVGTVAAINAGGNHSYSFVDYNPEAGISYYRLKLQDKDGKHTYSSIEAIKNSNTISLGAYPNPASLVLNVTHPEAKAGAMFTVYNLHGQSLLIKPVAKGSTFTSGVDISSLAPGYYLISFKNINESATITFLKQ